MTRSVYDLKAFYNTKTGRIVRRLLQAHLHDIWGDMKGMRVLGCGYAVPYLRAFISHQERVAAVMPAFWGVHAWPGRAGERNLACLAHGQELPFESNSIDRILMVHSLEFSSEPQQKLQEVWRVLKSTGRLIVIVPNRTGLWARADWSPFGQGTPYSSHQICSYLMENGFVHERTEEALFMPPLQHTLVLKSAGFFEKTGRSFWPIAAGVHIVEASKQLYARPRPGAGTKIGVREGAFAPRPALAGYKARNLAFRRSKRQKKV